MQRLRAGELRHPITIEQPTEGDASASGETTPSWSNVMSCKCALIPEFRQEYQRAKAVHSGMTHMLEMWHPKKTITADMRVRFDSRYLYIRAVKNVGERDRIMHLVCEEEVT